MSLYSKKSIINAPVEEVFKWHSMPGAIERLSPPWSPIMLESTTKGIKKGSEVLLKLKTGPVWLKWKAKHIEYEENKKFTDTQVSGPFAKWVHNHLFESCDQGKSSLEDVLEYKLHFLFLSRFVFEKIIRKRLKRIFTYRHETTALDLEDHLKYQLKKPLNILISGSDGLVGSSLVPYLTTGGHRVTRLVRKKANPLKNEIFWNPYLNNLNLDGCPNIDAVIHLSGEPIGEGRWTEQKKRKILESRIKSTQLIARAISELKNPPEVFVCASAIGYYGNRGNNELSEKDDKGSDFISMVCDEWEKSAQIALKNDIRTVLLRIGIVLSPMGGALKRLLFPFNFRFGTKIGSGSQYMSWVTIDDVLGAINHILHNESLKGAVNIVSPYPVTNAKFVKILAGILEHNIIFTIPEALINLVFKDMGREVLLSSTRAMPEKLINSGYRFRYSELEHALKHLLGRKSV